MLPELSPNVVELLERVSKFMDENVYPNEEKIAAEIAEGDRWQPSQILEGIKAKAKSEGLWNLFLPESDRGDGLTNYEYGHLCELMGRTQFGPEAFNCSAPDTGNMETLERYASEEVRDEWMSPLLEGKIRSAFAFGLTQIQSIPSGGIIVPFVSRPISNPALWRAFIRELSICNNGSPPVQTT